MAWGGEGGGVLLQAPGVLTWTVGYFGFQFFSLLFFTLLLLKNLGQGLGGGGERETEEDEDCKLHLDSGGVHVWVVDRCWPWSWRLEAMVLLLKFGWWLRGIKDAWD